MTELQVPQPVVKDDEMSFRVVVLEIYGWLHYLKTKWKIIFIVGIIGAILGFGYAFFRKPIYTATLTFALEDDKPGGGMTGALSLASSFGLDLGTGAGGAFSGANLIELMKSRRLIEQTLLKPVTVEGKSISLAELYIKFNGLREKWQKPGLSQELQILPDANRSKFSLQQDSVLAIIYSDIIKKHLTVEQRDKKVSIINIDVKTENEIFSKNFAETLAKEVSDFYIDTKSRKAKLNVDILEKQADSIRAELNSAIRGVAIANDNTYNLNPALNVKRTTSTRRQVDVQANTAILTELVKNLELARVTLRKETPLIQVIDYPIFPLQKQKTNNLKTLLLGGLLGVFFAVLFITGNRLWTTLMNRG
ncbi:MAG: Wzz/FepE/Etk N-terminal domain-containing protein [Bacteroidota bacterium]